MDNYNSQVSHSDNLEGQTGHIIRRLEKLPLGLKPRFIHEEQRHDEVRLSIMKRVAAGLEIPAEWLDEYHNYVRKHQG